jgi:anti-sigma B factor antagonist
MNAQGQWAGDNEDVTVIRLPRSADATRAAGITEQVRRALDRGARAMVLDCAGTEAIDAAGLHAVVRAHKALGVDHLALAGVGDAVSRMLTLTRLDRVFRVCATAEEAVSELAAREYRLCGS